MSPAARSRFAQYASAFLLWLLAAPLGFLAVAAVLDVHGRDYYDTDARLLYAIALSPLVPCVALAAAGGFILVGASRVGWGIVAMLCLAASAIPYGAFLGPRGWLLHGAAVLLLAGAAACFVHALGRD